MPTNVKMFPFIIFLTGASGAGKTTFLNALKHELPTSICFHFDSIGVPAVEEMIKSYGSPSEWQKVMTYQWINKLTSEYQNNELIILEGQVNLAFIVDALNQAGSNQYTIILVHCDNTIRHQRLHQDRKQPELVNENMDNWSNFLYKQATDMNVAILDTTSMNIDEMKKWFKHYLAKLH